MDRGERRKYQRYLKAIPMSYDLERCGEWVAGKGHLISIDMSAGGARVRCEEEVAEGDRLAISMDLEGHHFTTIARVVWINPSRVEGRLIAGLQFEEMDEASRDRVETSLKDGQKA